jgi:hypothetical protein
MTVVNPKSISGINSITMASGSDNLLTIHTTNTTERVRVNSDGDVIVGSGITVSPDGDIFATGVTTSTTFVGALTGNVTGNISGGTVAGSTGTFSSDVSVGGELQIADYIVHTGDGNTAIRFPSNDTITAETSGGEKLRIDSSGRLGLNIASPTTIIHANGNSTVGTSVTMTLQSHDTANSTSGIDFLARDNSNNNETCKIQAASGGAETVSLQFHTADTERFRVDASGTLLLGTTSYGGGGNDPILYVRTATANAVKIHKTGSGPSTLQLTCESGTDGSEEGTSAGLQLAQEGTSSYIANYDSGNMYISMGGVSTILHRATGMIRQRQAITGSTNTATYNENTAWSSFSANNSNSYDYKFINQSSSPAANYSVEIAAAADVDNTTYRHLNITKNSNSAGIFVVFGNGNVQNANNSYGQTSDVKLKENIVDANSQWDDIKNLRVRNFNFKSNSGFSTHTQIGLIAQEAETVSAGLVENVNDVTEDANGTKTETGEVTKQLKYSVLYMKAVKALQESISRIEVLETAIKNAGISTS